MANSALYREFVLSSPAIWKVLVAFIKQNAAACLENKKPLRVIVTAADERRNNEQNKRLWGYVYQNISEQAWVDGRQYSKDVWHEYYARKFGAMTEMILPHGEIVTRRKSTTEMTVGEFAEFMQRIEADAAIEFGVMFP